MVNSAVADGTLSLNGLDPQEAGTRITTWLTERAGRDSNRQRAPRCSARRG